MKRRSVPDKNKKRRVLFKGAVAQRYSQRTSMLEVAGSIPAPVIVELTENKF